MDIIPELTPRKKKFWIWGTAIALVGVIVAKYLVNVCPQEYGLYCKLVGIFIATIGLSVFMMGINKKS